ncbi:hypothetical protein C172_01935 [Paenibacillus sp. FSL H8-457]|nr:hypothetical protein C172_01935 [Paenibacillus sp. FSL H8-457]
MGTGKYVDRWGDPTQLANTDLFYSEPLYQVKAAVSYSMCILRSYIINEDHEHLAPQDEQTYGRLDSIVEDVLNAYVVVTLFKNEVFYE